MSAIEWITSSRIFEVISTWQYTVPALFIILYAIYYFKFARINIVVKGIYPQNKKNIGRTLPPYPNGWYMAAHSNQLSAGKSMPVDIAGQNIALYRGMNKVVYALEAYCLHMGANLGVGGAVVNEKCIQCPFHGWLYDGESGNCVDYDGKKLQLKSVQYNDNMCEKDGKLEWIQRDAQKASLRKFPVSQLNGYIYVWIHAMEEHQNTPIYPPLDVKSFIKNLSPRGRTVHHIACHIQDIPQNGSDMLHFKYVHTDLVKGWKFIGFNWQAKWKRADDEDIAEMFQHKINYVRDFKQRIWKQLIQPFPKRQYISIGYIDNYLKIPFLGQIFMFNVTIVQIGASLVFIFLKSPIYQIVFHHFVMPQAPAMQIVNHEIYISKWVPYWTSALALKLEGDQVTNDMFIWEAKQFKRSIKLADGKPDTCIKGWREWYSQNYEGCKIQQLKNKLDF